MLRFSANVIRLTVFRMFSFGPMSGPSMSESVFSRSSCEMLIDSSVCKSKYALYPAAVQVPDVIMVPMVEPDALISSVAPRRRACDENLRPSRYFSFVAIVSNCRLTMFGDVEGNRGLPFRMFFEILGQNSWTGPVFWPVCSIRRICRGEGVYSRRVCFFRIGIL